MYLTLWSLVCIFHGWNRALSKISRCVLSTNWRWRYVNDVIANTKPNSVAASLINVISFLILKGTISPWVTSISISVDIITPSRLDGILFSHYLFFLLSVVINPSILRKKNMCLILWWQYYFVAVFRRVTYTRALSGFREPTVIQDIFHHFLFRYSICLMSTSTIISSYGWFPVVHFSASCPYCVCGFSTRHFEVERSDCFIDLSGRSQNVWRCDIME